MSKNISGVERVALEMSRAIQDLISQGLVDSNLHFEGPRNAQLSGSSFDTNSGFHAGLSTGHIWEQFELPARTFGRWLFSPCNTGPILKTRQVLVIHDAQFLTESDTYSFWFRTWYRILLPIIARRSKAVVTVSEFSRAQLERHGIVPAGKCVVVYNGVDHMTRMIPDASVFSRLSIDPQNYILVVGSLAKNKNIRMLTRAALARPANSPEMIIVGGGASRIFGDASVPVGKGVRAVGRVSDAELRALYDNAMAFAFPSTTEGFGLPPLEAMICGCPVICSTGGALPEVCGDGAIFIDPHDEAGWTSQLVRIAEDSDLRARLGKRGQKVAEQYTWKKSAQAICKIFANLE